jgi:hypothetical protein
VGALSPLGKVGGRRGRWLANVTAYTLAGAATSALVGVVLGALGLLLLRGSARVPAAWATIGVALVAGARELGIVSFRLPQLARSTRDKWSSRFGPTSSALLWGLDLGLLFTTRFTFAGIWFLVVLAVAVQSPLLGATLFLVYWAGRAASVWIAPLLLEDANAGPDVLDAVRRHHRLFRQIHVAALALATAVLLWSLAAAPASAAIVLRPMWR